MHVTFYHSPPLCGVPLIRIQICENFRFFLAIGLSMIVGYNVASQALADCCRSRCKLHGSVPLVRWCPAEFVPMSPAGRRTVDRRLLRRRQTQETATASRPTPVYTQCICIVVQWKVSPGPSYCHKCFKC